MLAKSMKKTVPREPDVYDIMGVDRWEPVKDSMHLHQMEILMRNLEDSVKNLLKAVEYEHWNNVMDIASDMNVEVSVLEDVREIIAQYENVEDHIRYWVREVEDRLTEDEQEALEEQKILFRLRQ